MDLVTATLTGHPNLTLPEIVAAILASRPDLTQEGRPSTNGFGFLVALVAVEVVAGTRAHANIPAVEAELRRQLTERGRGT